MAVSAGEILTKGVEGLDCHPLEEPGEHTLLGFPIRVEPQLHQHQERSMEQKAEQETRRTTGIADESYQGVSRGQRPVEIESIYLSHSFGLGIWSMILFTSHERNSVATT